MSYAIFVADIAQDASEAMERLNQHHVLQSPDADEATHCRLVMEDLVVVEEEWRARRTAQERFKRNNLTLNWEVASPVPNMDNILKKMHWPNIPNYDRQPNPRYNSDHLQPTMENHSPLIPYSRPINRDNRTMLQEEVSVPMVPSPPSSPRRLQHKMVKYEAPTGPIHPIVFTPVKIEPKDSDLQVQANVQPGNPGAAFRVPNPRVQGTKMTYSSGIRKDLPMKVSWKATKSSVKRRWH